MTWLADDVWMRIGLSFNLFHMYACQQRLHQIGSNVAQQSQFPEPQTLLFQWIFLCTRIYWTTHLRCCPIATGKIGRNSLHIPSSIFAVQNLLTTGSGICASLCNLCWKAYTWKKLNDNPIRIHTSSARATTSDSVSF